MKITAHKTQLRTIKPGDPCFTIQDGIVVAQRAGFEINKNCPQKYQQIIAACIDQGWLKPVATMTERELLFLGLSQE